VRKYPYLKNPGFVVKNTNTYFQHGITWNDVATGNFCSRYVPNGYIYHAAGPMFFSNNDKIILAYFNSATFQLFADVICQGLHYSTGHIPQIPYIHIEDINLSCSIEELSNRCLSLSKYDWDSFETSWDFEVHPLISVIPKNRILFDNINSIDLAECFMCWENECNERFDKLKLNEEELNRIFIDIYGLQDELTPEVEDKDVTVRKADLGRDIRSLLSYAVGCMFGRYSLDERGLVYAGGEWDSSKYSTFIPDTDNCIPITDEAYFEDDIVGLFVNWMKKTFGEENLEANLDFIAKALGNKGTTSREVIRNYFLNDFIKDHIKLYQKRPIYWLFDSGKQNGFKALVYMHRWNADTVGNVRVEYLHKMQHIYEREIQRMQENIDNSNNSKEIAKANKRKEKLQKQLKETQDYDTKLAHIALSRIDIDLDDGVKVNYEKVQTGRDGKKMQILAKL